MTIGTKEDIEKNEGVKEIMKEEKSTDNKNEEKFPCDKCEKIFLKKHANNLHMNSAHNKKAHQYTPGLAKRKVGRPATKFICEVCKIRMNTDNELKNQMTSFHRYPKRTRSDMRHESIQRIASVSKSPPNKKVKDKESNKDSDIKDIHIARLEAKNACLVEAADTKQGQLNKQAIIIGDLREDLQQVTIALEVKVSEFKRVEGTNATLVETLVSKDDKF